MYGPTLQYVADHQNDPRDSWIAWLANQEALHAVQTLRKTIVGPVSLSKTPFGGCFLFGKAIE